MRRYQGPMFGPALRMLSRQAGAEDVVQEVFLTAWRRLAQRQEDAAFVGWLHRATTNRCLNALRARRPVAELRPEQQGRSAQRDVLSRLRRPGRRCGR